MADHWVFNKYYTYPSVGELRKPNSPLKIRSSLTRLPIKEESKYIFVQPNFSIGNYTFTQFGIVKKIGTIEPIELTDAQKLQNKILKREKRPPLPQEYLHTFILEDVGEIKENRELVDYSYSLLSVNNYLNPKRHFQQQYRAVHEYDYETITREQIYIARTAFGRLINALPKESKYDFVLYAIEEFGTVEFRGIDFIKAYEFLWKYINDSILSQGRYITSAFEILSEKFGQTGVPIDKVGFANHADEEKGLFGSDLKGDNLSIQARYFQNLFEHSRSNTLSYESLKSVTKNDEEERRFGYIFSNRLWPVDMNL